MRDASQLLARQVSTVSVYRVEARGMELLFSLSKSEGLGSDACVDCDYTAGRKWASCEF